MTTTPSTATSTANTTIITPAPMQGLSVTGGTSKRRQYPQAIYTAVSPSLSTAPPLTQQNTTTSRLAPMAMPVSSTIPPVIQPPFATTPGSAYGTARPSLPILQPQQTPLDQPNANPNANPNATAQDISATSSPAQTLQAPTPTPTRGRIEVSQMPNPSCIDTNPIIYRTSQGYPPSSQQPAVLIDDANCSPRFMRLTTYQFPATADLASACGIPLAAVITPLATMGANESVPLVDHGKDGPVRCARCRAYINPFVKFGAGGREYMCKMCGMVNQVPEFFFSPLEIDGQRADHQARPELSRGTVEYVASNPMYMSQGRVLQPGAFLFVIDITDQAVSSGITAGVIACLKAILADLPPSFPASVGFLTYGSQVHFWDLTVPDKPRMIVVPDVENVFVPLHSGIFVKPNDPRVPLFLDKLVLVSTKIKDTSSTLGAALAAAAAALKPIGGKILAFHSSMPVTSPGPLKVRESPKIFGTEKEKVLFTSQTTFYHELATQCQASKTGIDLFVFSQQTYMDIATLGDAFRLSGGQLFYYDDRDLLWNLRAFNADLLHSLTRTTGYDAALRVRTNNGLTVSGYHGHMAPSRNGTDIELAAVDSDKTLLVFLKHEEKLEERSDAIIQCAILYTTMAGERRIRVHTLGVPVVAEHSPVFKGADLDALVCVNAHRAADLVLSAKYNTVSGIILDSTVQTLAMYRKHCATSTNAGQLILPESLKLLPIFTCALLKSPMLLSGKSSDLRCQRASIFKSSTPEVVVAMLYPRVFPLHILCQNQPDSDGTVPTRLPPVCRLARDYITNDGAYLLYDGTQLLIYIMHNTPPEVLETLFGTTSVVDMPTAELCQNFCRCTYSGSSPILPLLQSITEHHGHSQLPLHVVVAGTVGYDGLFISRLVEDKVDGENPSFMDFLCQLHKLIHHKLQ